MSIFKYECCGKIDKSKLCIKGKLHLNNINVIKKNTQ